MEIDDDLLNEFYTYTSKKENFCDDCGSNDKGEKGN